MTQQNYRVAIVQETVPHYRVPFFADLRKALAAQDVTVALLYGRPTDDLQAEELRLALPWARAVDLHVVGAKGVNAIYQPVVRLTAGADLVIVEQANRMLSNYALLARQAAGGPGVAFWGHGANLQAGDGSLARIAEQWKRTYSNRPHWWFAYTEGSAERVEELGFDRDRITVVQNAVDTAWATGVAEVVREPHRCVYVGRLYKEKRLDFLVEACGEVAKRIPDFSLVVLGDGPERAHLDELATTRPWLTVRGTVVGHAKAVELAQASLHLMPGLVGLAVVDSFATATPLVTTDVPFHSPEVEYLVHGVNGVVLPGSTSAAEYGTTVAELLHDERALRKLRAGCRTAAKRYTLAAMVERFADGVVEAVHSSEETTPAYVVARDRAWNEARNALREGGRRASRVTARTVTRVRPRTDLVHLGSADRGWSVPADLLDKYSTCYVAGGGADTSFHEALIALFGCAVWAFDPSPEAVAHAVSVTDPRFHFTDVGLGSEHVGNLMPVSEVARKLGHDEVDLLTLDFANGVNPVVERMLDDGVRPRVLCVVLDEIARPWRQTPRLRRLTSSGYRAVHAEGRRYTFVLDEA